MTDKMYVIAATLIESECREKFSAATTTEDKLREAFKVAHNHWMITGQDDQFKGAIGAVMMHLASGPEYDRLAESVTQLGKASALIHALQQGVPVDLAAMLQEQEDNPMKDQIIPLSKLWNEVRA